MTYQLPLGRRASGAALLARMATVLDPLATRYGGQPAEIIKPVLAGVWRRAFDAELPEPTLTRCAQSIHDHTPWVEELWPDGWSQPDHPVRGVGNPCNG